MTSFPATHNPAHSVSLQGLFGTTLPSLQPPGQFGYWVLENDESYTNIKDHYNCYLMFLFTMQVNLSG